ncbi:PaaX family transcriptional regulator C-terminal domain-containing protein [Pseudodonghicola flavimaris]|uniref:PaaX family transcriptional regulator C-terminal domain-containing protein n=1 Tax=Pseudodonghicola flavimaris TaxID=3050036 RepID=A0ABT7F2W9_9RHOB|nr:PaaX family transcriptional regulator C-terminal domain-containing protein [Pseudodonghicola flavimaris]MDK3018946.1 PaaX family transcriptional regulator C-terminal domain-containing protein [Pseudodonghicola flavimaris]
MKDTKDSWQDSWFDTCAALLTDPQNLRVWSVIVSLFGDLAQRPGDRLSGGALSRIIMPAGIKPEAIRVALHRLRKDGWIDSARQGRASAHFLTDYGRAQSAEVSPRIYTRAAAAPEAWHLLIAEDGAGQTALDDLLLAEEYFSIARNVALGAGPVPEDIDDDLLVFDASARTVPAWVRLRACPPELSEAAHGLLRDLSQADALLPRTPEAISPLQIATLRMLIVHRWRRVVLRQPDLPAAFFPADWPGPACRAAVFDLLDRLPRPALAELEAE